MPRSVPALITTFAILALAHPVLAQTMVKEVDVEVDVSAIENEAAAAYWTNVGPDLENAIALKLGDLVAPDGVKVSIDIAEVELGNSFESALGLTDSKLGGRVKITSDTDNSKFETYDLLATFDQTYLPPGVSLESVTTDSPEYYATMVDIFADRVVEKLSE